MKFSQTSTGKRLVPELSLAVLISCALIGLEWLFFVTKPSFMSLADFPWKLSLLFATFSPAMLFTLAIVLILTFVSKLLSLVCRGSIDLNCFFLGFLLAITVNLLFTNFLYTMFNVGPSSLGDHTRLSFGVLFLLLFLVCASRVETIVHQWSKNPKPFGLIACCISLLVISNFVFYVQHNLPIISELETLNISQANRPNVIIISADAVSAEYLSAYGFDKETTPFLNRLKERMLVFENAFTNVNRTTGSLTSLLSGRSSAKTQVISTPSILTRQDSLEHLPGILKRMGYKALQAAYPSANDTNMLRAFDVINYSCEENLSNKVISLLPTLAGSPVVYFMQTIYEKVRDLLAESFGVKRVHNYFAQLTTASNSRVNEEAAIENILTFVKTTTEPMFIHAHLLTPHGPYYQTRSNKFVGKNDKPEFRDLKAYFDAIADFDEYTAQIVTALEASGKLANTILVVHSDHDRMYSLTGRVPLLILLPGNDYAGRIKTNAQLLDIAPTILDFMGIEIPKFMDGESLISPGLNKYRMIHGFRDAYPKTLEFIDAPPYFNIERLSLIICNRSYELALNEKTIYSGSIEGHTAECLNQEMLNSNQLMQIFISQLKKRGINTINLENKNVPVIEARDAEVQLSH